MHDWLSNDTFAGPHTLPATFRFTDDERQLHDLAYPLIEEPYNRQQWYSVFGEYNEIVADPRGVFDHEEYAHRLFTAHYRSPSAQYARLTDDVRNDITRVPQFFETATRVLDIDEKRRKSLAYISDIQPKERDTALQRIRENASLVSLVRTKLTQRVTAYHFALERLILMTPSPQAVEVERSINELRAKLEYYRTHSAPTWEREQSLAWAR
jgi:hypothetical protein